jgi:hypothetical protein
VFSYIYIHTGVYTQHMLSRGGYSAHVILVELGVVGVYLGALMVRFIANIGCRPDLLGGGSHIATVISS